MATIQESERPIFRPAAVDHHERRRFEAVMPRYLRPSGLAALWAFAALLAAGAGLAWSTRVPVRARGAVVVLSADGGGLTLAVIGAPGAPLAAGQPVLATFPDGTRAAGELALAEERDLSAAELRARLGLEGALALAVEGPGRAATARVAAADVRDAAGGRADPALLAGALGAAEVVTGSRRVLALLPGLGRLLEDDEPAR